MSFVSYRVETTMKPQAVIEPLRAASATRFQHVGARIRKNIQSRLRYRKGPSRPGQPPNIHRGRRQPESPLAKSILFGQPDPMSVIVGAADVVGKSGMVARILELGGTATSSDGKRIKIEARPFMRPAAYEEAMKAPNLWANSL